jgi:hypothetical protein
MKQKIASGSEIGQFISAKGIVGRGATALRRIMAQSFPGMSISEAIKQGREAWLDAGLGEENARRIFDEATAIEARRRTDARGNARKKKVAAEVG